MPEQYTPLLGRRHPPDGLGRWECDAHLGPLERRGLVEHDTKVRVKAEEMCSQSCQVDSVSIGENQRHRGKGGWLAGCLPIELLLQDPSLVASMKCLFDLSRRLKHASLTQIGSTQTETCHCPFNDGRWVLVERDVSHNMVAATKVSWYAWSWEKRVGSHIAGNSRRNDQAERLHYLQRGLGHCPFCQKRHWVRG